MSVRERARSGMPNPAPAAAFWCAPQREAYVRTRLDGVKEQATCERVCAGDPACTGYVYGEERCELRGEVVKTDAVACGRGLRPLSTPSERG